MTHMFARSEGAHSSASLAGLGLAIGVAIGLTACAPAPPATQRAVATAQRSSPPPASAQPPVHASEPSAEPTAASSAAASIPLSPADPASLPGWGDDRLDGLAGAIDRQCALSRPPVPWPGLCGEFRAQRPALRGWLERRFRAQPLVGADGAAEGLITGYLEAELSGSRQRVSATQVPLYRRPPTAQLSARPTRAQIEDTSLFAGRELVWIDDPVAAFFLQIQGSGRIRLRDGTTMRVGYAADNGQPYVAIGRVLIERGALSASEVDAASIKAWLRANPSQARSVMQANPRYIFFRELPATPDDAGPPGALGVALTPMRSVAVDPKRVPRGALLFLDTTHPVDGTALRRVVLAQDTGAAITGPVRADLFWGRGPDAERAAGLMKQRGRLWLLVPRD